VCQLLTFRRYSASHELFLSSRQAVYILVFPATDPPHLTLASLRFWLSLLAPRAGPLVRLLFVATKIDLVPTAAAEHLRVLRGGLERLVRRFMRGAQGGVELFPFSAVNEFGDYKRLRRAIKDKIYEKVEEVIGLHALYPARYFEILEKVNRIAKRLKRDSRLPFASLTDPILVSEFGPNAARNQDLKNGLLVLQDLGAVLLADGNDPLLVVNPNVRPRLASLTPPPPSVDGCPHRRLRGPGLPPPPQPPSRCRQRAPPQNAERIKN
jgi:hypothetical protein